MRKFAVAAAVFVMAFASMACAEVIEFPNVKLDVPAGWQYQTDDNGNAIMQAPDGLWLRVELVPYEDGMEEAILNQMMKDSGAKEYEQGDDGMIEFTGSNGYGYALYFYETGYALCYTANDKDLSMKHAQEIVNIMQSVQEHN